MASGLKGDQGKQAAGLVGTRQSVQGELRYYVAPIDVPSYYELFPPEPVYTTPPELWPVVTPVYADGLLGAVGLDCAVLGDGEGYHAHGLYWMGASANRLIKRKQVLLTTVWPKTIRVTTDFASFTAPGWSQYIWPWATRLTDSRAWTILKRKGIRRGTAYVHATVTSGAQVLMYFGTSQWPLPSADQAMGEYMAGRLEGPQVLSMVGTGSPANYVGPTGSSNFLEFGAADVDELSIMCRAVGDGVIGSSTDGGTPSYGTIGSPSGDPNDYISKWQISYGSTAAWRTGANSANPGTWATTGHYVRFLDTGGGGGGVDVVVPRRIVDVLGDPGYLITFEPELSPEELRTVVSAGGHFEITKAPELQIHSIVVVSEEVDL